MGLVEIVAADQAAVAEAQSKLSADQAALEAAQPHLTALDQIAAYVQHLPAEIQAEFSALIAGAKSLF